MCERGHDLKLDLGCGEAKRPGYVGIDRTPAPGVDIVRDIERGLPFCDNSVVEVNCSHVLEHIQDLIFVMNEIWRVCRPGAIVHVEVPHSGTPQAFQDPTHVRYFNEYSFGYFEEHHRLRGQYGIEAKFRVAKQERDGWILRVRLEVVKP